MKRIGFESIRIYIGTSETSETSETINIQYTV
jgi:hypothetical protein